MTAGDGSYPGACIIASGVACAHTGDWLEELGLLGRVDFFQVTMPYPLNRDFIQTVHTRYEKILVIEETYPVIELQLADARVQGRTSGLVPRAGELTPDVIRPVLETFLDLPARVRPGPAGRRRPAHPLRRLLPPGGVLRHQDEPSRGASSPATSAATPWA